MSASLSTRVVAALLLAGVAASAPAGAAETAAQVDPAVEERIAKLEGPPSPEVVMDLVKMSAVARDRATALRVVGVLWHTGGYGSAIGLRALVMHSDSEVRARALRGIGHVGIRVEEGFDVVRQRLGDLERPVRDAAFEAVSRVGDGSDVPALLEATASEDVAVRHVAFRALTVISGQRIPWDSGRWVAWWEETKTEMPQKLQAALDVLEQAGEGADLVAARATVQRHAWMMMPVVRETVRAWMRSSEMRLRIEGYRFAQTLRLGDLADELWSSFRYELKREAWDVARESATSLGLRTKDVVFR